MASFMKKTRLGLIFLLTCSTLIATGCAKNDVDQSSESLTSSTSALTSSTSSKGGSSSSSPTATSSSTLDTPVSSSQQEPVSSTSSSTPVGQVNNSTWKTKNSTAYNLMLTHLGGQTIPYFSFGTGASWYWDYNTGYSSGVKNETYGSIVVETDLDFDTNYDTLSALYTSADGWVEDSSSSSGSYSSLTVHTFVNDISHITVKIYDDDGFIIVHILYDEPYDKSQGTGWDTDLVTAFKDTFGTYTIPYIYLGTAHNLSEADTGTNKATVYGMKFSDQVITDAQATFADLNAAITGSSTTTASSVKNGFKTRSYRAASRDDEDAPISSTEDGDADSSASSSSDPGSAVSLWQVTPGSDGKSLTASFVEPNNDVITIVIDSDSYGRTRMVVTMKEMFNPTKYSDWSQDVHDAMNDNLHGHILPYFSMGTNDPSFYWYSYSNELDLTGSDFDEAGITNLKTVLENDHPTAENAAKGETEWTITLSTYNGYSYSSSMLSASKTYADGCDISFFLRNNYNGKFYSEITIDPIIDPGTTYTAYATNTQTLIDNNLDGHDVPYVYLNLGAGYGYSEYAAWNADSHTVSIRGGEWSDKELNYAKGVFTTAGWSNITVDTADKKLTASKTYNGDGEDGCTITATVHSGGSSYYPYAYCDFKLTEKWNPTSYTDWTDDTKTKLTTNMDTSVALPFVYLGTKAEAATYNSSTHIITIVGNAWDDSIPTSFAAAYDTQGVANTAGWTWSNLDTVRDDNGNVTYNAQGVHNDGGKLLVTLAKNDYDSPVMTVTYFEKYDPTALTDWPDAVKTAFATDFGEPVTVPLVYLGSKNVSIITSKTNQVVLEGGAFNDQVLTDAKTSLAAAGYTTFDTANSDYRALTAYKGDGTTEGLRMYLYRNGTYETSYTRLEIDYSPVLDSKNAVNLSTLTAWDSTTLSQMSTGLSGHAVKYLPVPALPVSFSTSSFSYNLNMYNYGLGASSGDLFSFNYLLKAKSAIETSGEGRAELSLSRSSSDFTKPVLKGTVKAYKLNDDGSFGEEDGTVNFVYFGISSDSGYDIYMTYYPKFEAPTGADASWSTATQKAMKTYFDGNLVPYVYLGTKTPTFSTFNYSTGTLSCVGGGWDDSIYTAATTAFATSDGWTTGFNTYGYSGKAFVAEKTFGTKTMTVVIYPDRNDSYNSAKTQMYVYYR